MENNARSGLAPKRWGEFLSIFFEGKVAVSDSAIPPGVVVVDCLENLSEGVVFSEVKVTPPPVKWGAASSIHGFPEGRCAPFETCGGPVGRKAATGSTRRAEAPGRPLGHIVTLFRAHQIGSLIFIPQSRTRYRYWPFVIPPPGHLHFPLRNWPISV